MTERDWARVRGIGRERFASHIAEYLTSAGFAVERTESTDPSESGVLARLNRMNPAVPDGGKEIAFHVYPTSGGSAATWDRPESITEPDRPRMIRFARELFAHVERSVLTETHGTSKVTRAPGSQLPWESAPAQDAPAVSNAARPRP
ncbi:MAG TPA: hypothetical protein VFF67_10530 [Thermoplasmata archaeon]|nr:hypothetical protein [Thermoplasmata archaeon]